MKKILRSSQKFAIVAIVCLLAIFHAGCNSWVDSTINVDPNNPQDVQMSLLLPTIEGTLAFNYGSDASRIAGLWTQHHEGADKQHGGFYIYKIGEGDDNNLWLNVYSMSMINADLLIRKANASKSPQYAAVGKVLQAFAVDMMTDLYGDIPFTEAFQGEKNLQPKTDSQQDLYTKMASMLNEAILQADSASVFVPGDEDIIYKGDMTKWKRAAYSLLARLANHQTKRDPVGSATAALAAAVNGFKSNEDDLRVKFGTTETNANPLFAFIQARTGDIAIGPKLIELLNNSNDPRRAAIGDKLKSTDTIKSSTDFGSFYTASDAPVILSSFAELKFIEAEARLRSGDKVGAKAAYSMAVDSSLAWYGVSAADAATYKAQASVIPAGDITLQNIMEQKYVALYTQAETFVDWRRTNFPTLTPTSGSAVPRRFPTPQNQQLFNSSNLPAGATASGWIFKPMWWDE